MNQYTDRGMQLGCLGTVLAIIAAITYLATSSLNPLAVLDSDNMLAKVVVILLLVMFVLGCLQQLLIGAQIWNISRTSGRRAADLTCPGCGLPLLKFAGSHGQPAQCTTCQTWWHAGPMCFRKGLHVSVLRLALEKCPDCRAKESSRTSFDINDLFQ
jgi:hypothetical protein